MYDKYKNHIILPLDFECSFSKSNINMRIRSTVYFDITIFIHQL